MSNIKVQCIDQAIGFLNTPVISSGNVNYDTITFDFCSKWDGFAKTAIFYRTKDEVYYGILDETNSCIIPREVLSEKGTFYIGVFGSKDDVTITSAVLAYKVQEGALTENTKPSDPTPDIYDQLIAKYAEYNSKLDSQVKRMDDLEDRLDTGVGDAEKLGGQLPSYYASAQSVTDIVNGTKKVSKASTADSAGDSSKLGGKGASEYFLKSGGDIDGTLHARGATDTPIYNHANSSTDESYIGYAVGDILRGYIGFKNGKAHVHNVGDIATTADLANYLPKRDGTINGSLKFKTVDNGYAEMTKAHGSDFDNGTAIYDYDSTGSYVALVLQRANGLLRYYDDHGGKDILHEGNVGDYALPKSGGKLSGTSGSPLKLENTDLNIVGIDMFGPIGHLGTFGVNGANNPIFFDNLGNPNKLLHTGNSSPIVPVNVDPGVGASVTYADGTVLFVYEEE